MHSPSWLGVPRAHPGDCQGFESPRERSAVSYIHALDECISKRTTALHDTLNKGMPANVIVWDIETIPGPRGYAAANDLVGRTDDDIRAAMGDKFPKHIYHSIVCIGALVAHRDNGGPWMIDALGAPHVGERPEKALIGSFVDSYRSSTT